MGCPGRREGGGSTLYLEGMGGAVGIPPEPLPSPDSTSPCLLLRLFTNQNFTYMTRVHDSYLA